MTTSIMLPLFFPASGAVMSGPGSCVGGRSPIQHSVAGNGFGALSPMQPMTSRSDLVASPMKTSNGVSSFPFPRLPGSGGAPRRVLLTSSGLTNPKISQSLVSLLQARKPQGDPKIMYVPDAGIGNGGNVQSLFQDVRMQLSKLGVSRVVCCELRRMSPAALAAQLDGVDGIYVDMGNTFYLRHFMRTSGFDKLVPPLIKDHGVVWFGSSAGSIVAGRTVSTALWKGWDDPGQGQEWDQTKTDYAGLDLLEGKSIFPHYNPQFNSLVNQRKGELGHELVVLAEEQFHIEGLQEGANAGVPDGMSPVPSLQNAQYPQGVPRLMLPTGALHPAGIAGMPSVYSPPASPPCSYSPPVRQAMRPMVMACC